MKYVTPEVDFLFLSESDRILSTLGSGESAAYGNSASWDDAEVKDIIV